MKIKGLLLAGLLVLVVAGVAYGQNFVHSRSWNTIPDKPEITVGDSGYGSTLASAVAAIGSNVRTLVVPPGTYNVAADLTIPPTTNLKPERGAIFAVANGKTLTINGKLDAGTYQIFNCTGTGKVLFGDGAVSVAYLEWFGGSPTATNTVNDAAWASLTTALTSTYGRGQIQLLSGYYHFSAAINLPYTIDLYGMGGLAGKTLLYFDNATDGLVVDGVSDYKFAPTIRDLFIYSNSTGLVGLKLKNLNHPVVERVTVHYFTQQGILVDYCLLPKFDSCLLGGNGGPSYAQMEVDHSTCFIWINNRISGNNLAGNTAAGLRIDRTGPVTILGGAIESTNTMIQLASKAESASTLDGCTIVSLDLENPGNGNAYIEAGYGWSGVTGEGVRNLNIIGLSCSRSGTTSVPYGIKLKHTCNSRIAVGGQGLPNGATAWLWLEGTTNRFFSMPPNGYNTYLPSGCAYVMENGAVRGDASSESPWYQEGQAFRPTIGGNLTQNSSTPALPVPLPGLVYTNNTAPTTINTLLPIDGVSPKQGVVLYITCADTNTSIAHYGGSGSCRINTPTGATVPLVNGRIYPLIYNYNNGHWTLLSPVNDITGNAATATKLATARAIYGNNFDGSAALTQIIASTYGGTGNGFTKFSGPATSEKTKTLRDAADTILELGGSYTPTGTWNWGTATVTWPTFNQNTSGNAATATKVVPRVVTVPSNDATLDSGNAEYNVDNADQFIILALAQATDFGVPGGTPTDGQKFLLRIKDDGTARALTWNAIFRAGTEAALPTTTVLSKTMYCSFIYNNADTKWDFVGQAGGF